MQLASIRRPSFISRGADCKWGTIGRAAIKIHTRLALPSGVIISCHLPETWRWDGTKGERSAGATRIPVPPRLRRDRVTTAINSEPLFSHRDPFARRKLAVMAPLISRGGSAREHRSIRSPSPPIFAFLHLAFSARRCIAREPTFASVNIASVNCGRYRAAANGDYDSLKVGGNEAPLASSGELVHNEI